MSLMRVLMTSDKKVVVEIAGKNYEEDVTGDEDVVVYQFGVGEVEAASDAELVD